MFQYFLDPVIILCDCFDCFYIVMHWDLFNSLGICLDLFHYTSLKIFFSNALLLNPLFNATSYSLQLLQL